MYSATGLIRDIIILSSRVEQSLRTVFIVFNTSSLFVFCSINCSVVKLSGSDLMKNLISENLVDDFSVTRVVKLLKNLLILLIFPLMVVVVGFNILLNVFQISLLFFQFKTFL